jgi:flagellar motor switch protein FliN/FliY
MTNEGNAPTAPDAGAEATRAKKDDATGSAPAGAGADTDADKVRVGRHAVAELEPDPKPAGGGERAAMDLLFDVPVDVTVELGSTSVPLEDVLKFGPGHVVRLAQSTDQPVIVKVNGRPIAEGEMVDLGDTLGVRITAILEARDGAGDAERGGSGRPTP